MIRNSSNYNDNELLKYINRTFYMDGGSLHRVGEPHHKFSKCRIDRDVDTLIKQVIAIGPPIQTDRVIFMLEHQYRPDIVMRNDIDELIDVSPTISKIYADRNLPHATHSKKGYISQITTPEGKCLKKWCNTPEQAQEWFSQQRELYRDIFTELNLLSYFK